MSREFINERDVRFLLQEVHSPESLTTYPYFGEYDGETFDFSQKVGREMIGRGGGKIINISSYAGLGGTDPNYLDAIPYNTSKGALVVFTSNLAIKLYSYNINVNCIAPGWFPTKMTKWTLDSKSDGILKTVPLGRFGRPNELKGAVVSLASRAADYITGHVLSVDGGIGGCA